MQPQLLKKYIKLLNDKLERGDWYDDEEYIKSKKELYQAKQLRKLLNIREKSIRNILYNLYKHDFCISFST